MKKVLKPLALIALAVSLMPSCKDTNDDAPYVDPNKQIDNPVNGDDELPEGTFIKETLTGKLGVFKSVSNSEVSFDCGPSYTKISGYVNGSNVATDAYLVSEKVNLSGQDKVFYQFESIVAYEKGNADEHHQFLVSTEYTGDPTTTKWDVLPVTFEVNAGKPADWNKFVLTSKNLDSKYYVDGVVFAFHYVCGTSNATTFEFKNVTVKAGECQESITPVAPVEAGIGSQENPASVTEALAASVVSQTTEATASYVKGFIVGYVPGQKVDEAVIGTSGTVSETNLLLAATADEKDYKKCLVIQLPTGKIRTALNLKANPTVLGKEVVLGGYIQTYFGVNGLKSAFYAALVGGDVIQGTTSTLGFDGTDNTAKVVTSIDQSFLNSVQGDFSIYNKNLAKGLSFVWSATKDYGMKATATVGSTKYESEAWMISPAVDLSAYTTGVDYEFNMAANNYGSNDKVLELVKFLVSKDYVAGSDPSTATWEELKLTNSKYGTSWDYLDEKLDLSSYKGEKNVHVAFKYISTADVAGTFEIKSLYLGAPRAAEAPVSGFDGTDKTQTVVSSFPYSNILKNEFGDFSVYDVSKYAGKDPNVWIATKYGATANSTQVSESWMISPKFDLAGLSKPSLEFTTWWQNTTSTENYKAYILVDYDGSDITKATKTPLSIVLNEKASTNSVNTIDLSSYVGKKITIAFQYVATDDLKGKFEIFGFGITDKDATSGDSGDSGEGGDSGNTEADLQAYLSNVTLTPFADVATATGKISFKGYIVGFYQSKAYFTNSDAKLLNSSGLLISEDKNATSLDKCVCIQLPAGDIRNALNLLDNPDMFGKEVIVYGNRERFNGMDAGIKSTSYAIDVEALKDFGTRP